METLSNKTRQHKQTLTNKRRRRSDSPPAAAGPRWLMLNSCIDEKGGNSSVADAKTTAASCTSLGKPFSISFGIVAPPACFSLHFDWLGGGMPGDSSGKHFKLEVDDVRIFAGHDDAVLIEIRMPTTFDDYFVYEAGGGAWPPPLSLLPAFNVPVQKGYSNHPDRRTPRYRQLGMENTGILRRGEDDLVVCQFELTCDPPIHDMADLCMIRFGRDREWIVKRVPIIEHREGSSELQPWQRNWKKHPGVQVAVPVGNRFLCWVDYNHGFILCNLSDEETPKVRYVSLPAKWHDCVHWHAEMQATCTLGAAGPVTVRFVSVRPLHCSCSDGKTSCQGSSSFNITTWTMTLSTEDATTWVKDIVLNCDEIWKWPLPNYGCLPRDKPLEYPKVSSDDPDVTFFKVEAMAVEINTRSNKLLSVVPSGGTRDQDEDEDSPHLVTAKLGW